MLKRTRRNGGTVMVIAAMASVALLGFVSLALDVGVMINGRTQLQHASDAGARAALQELRDSGSYGSSKREASRYARANPVFNRPVEVDVDRDVEIGHYSYRARTFTKGLGFGAPAVRVTARATKDSPTGPLQLFFAPLFGMASADVEASAVASIRRRDLVIVQDRTVSFMDAFPVAIDADKTLVDSMDDQGLPGDRVGVVSFARDVIEEEELTRLDGMGTSDLHAALDGVEICTGAGRPGGPCYGTDIAIGIDTAREMLDGQSTEGDAEQVIVVVSDGVPCLLERGPQAVRLGQLLATGAADRAGEAGISIFSITLDQGSGGGHLCLDADVSFNESLARGFGFGTTTTDEDELDDLLTSIIRQMPVYLVR